jgi:O-antigen ligase
MATTKDKIVKICDRVIEVSLYGTAFYIPISNALISIFSSLAIFSWVVKKIALRSRPKDIFYPTFLRGPIFLFLATMIFSCVFSGYHLMSLRHFFYKTFKYAVFFFVIAESLDRRILRNILGVLVFSASLTALSGLHQFYRGKDFLRLRTPVIHGRINGPFYYPNSFAHYIVSLFPLTVWLSLIRYRRKAWNFILPVLSALLLFSLVLSATRSAWLALLALVPFAAFTQGRKFTLCCVLIVALIAFLGPLMPGLAKYRIENFFNYREDAPVFDRDFLWKDAFDMFLNRPVFGQGLGTFMFNFQRFRPQGYPADWGISYAENTFLQLAAETGIIGLFGFLYLIVAMFYFFLRRLKACPDKKYRHIGFGLAGCMVTYLVSSIFVSSFYSMALAFLFWLLLGLVAGLHKIILLEPGNNS